MEGKKIEGLLVDDSKTMRKIIKNILVQIGIENIVEADHLKHALEVLEEHQVDMIISDWSMPVLDGVEMTKKNQKGRALCQSPHCDGDGGNRGRDRKSEKIRN